MTKVTTLNFPPLDSNIPTHVWSLYFTARTLGMSLQFVFTLWYWQLYFSSNLVFDSVFCIPMASYTI
jgi:hypothetical protein